MAESLDERTHDKFTSFIAEGSSATLTHVQLKRTQTVAGQGELQLWVNFLNLKLDFCTSTNPIRNSGRSVAHPFQTALFEVLSASAVVVGA